MYDIDTLLGIKRINGAHQIAKKPLLINDLKLLIKAIDELEKLKNIEVEHKSLQTEKV